jgi:hypothetical protein
MRRSLAVDRLRSLSLPNLRRRALDASQRVGDDVRPRFSVVRPSRTLTLLPDLPAQLRDHLVSPLSAQVELGGNARIRRRAHKDVDFDVLGSPCAPVFLDSEHVDDALRGASAQRAPAPALRWGQAALIAPRSALPVCSDAGHERPESNLVPGIAIRGRESAGNNSAVNIEQKNFDKAVDPVGVRSVYRVIKERRAGEGTEQKKQVYNVPASEIYASSVCYRNIGRGQSVSSRSKRPPPAFNCAFLVNFALVMLTDDRQSILKRRRRPGLVIYRHEYRYCRIKCTNVAVLARCGEAAMVSNPICFATLSNPLPTLNERP